jgi:hypothetical protein
MAAMAAVTAAIQVKQSGDAADAAKKQGDILQAQGVARGAQIERQGDRLISSQLAASGAGGGIPSLGSDFELQLETARESRMRQLDEVYAGALGKWGKDQEAVRHQQDQWTAGIKGVGNVLGSLYGGGVIGGGSGPGSVAGASVPSSSGFMGSSYGRTRRYP